MSFVLAIALQTAVASPAPPPDFDLARLAPIDFDLTRLRGSGGCQRDESTITVCGRREPGAYPMAEMARIFEPAALVARTGVAGNLIADIHVQAAVMPDGTVSNRILFGLRLPF